MQKFVTEIFQVKIGLSPELMSDTFKFIEKPHYLRINSASRPDDPNGKIWHRNKKIWHRIFFQMNVKLSSSLWTFKANIKTYVPENSP